MQFTFVQRVDTKDAVGGRRVIGARASFRPTAAPVPAPSRLTDIDYDRMSRAARRISTSGNGSFMEAFKKANPDWKPVTSKRD